MELFEDSTPQSSIEEAGDIATAVQSNISKINEESSDCFVSVISSSLTDSTKHQSLSLETKKEQVVNSVDSKIVTSDSDHLKRMQNSDSSNSSMPEEEANCDRLKIQTDQGHSDSNCSELPPVPIQFVSSTDSMPLSDPANGHNPLVTSKNPGHDPLTTSKGQGHRPGVILLGRGNSFSLGRSEVILLHSNNRFSPKDRRRKVERNSSTGSLTGISSSSSSNNKLLENGDSTSNLATVSELAPSPPPLSTPGADDCVLLHPLGDPGMEAELERLWARAEETMVARRAAVERVLQDFGIGEGQELEPSNQEEEEEVWRAIQNQTDLSR